MALIARNAHVLQSNNPLSNEQIMRVAPSIFATEPHTRMSDRYTEIPTIHVLNALPTEGIIPFMVAQTKVRDAGRREFTLK